MKKMLILCLLIHTFGKAQIKGDYSLGKTTIDELKMVKYDKDPEAEAVFLEEKGETETIKGSLRYQFHTTYYARIKIFKKSGLTFANRRIFHDKALPLKNIEAISYNLNSDGQIVTAVLPLDQIFRNKVFNNLNSTSFAIPNVKEGSVIEFKYTIRGYGYELYDWYFQSTIPKVKSSYDAYVLDNTNFNIRIIGYLKPNKTLKTRSKCRSMDENCSKIYYEMSDIPAFKKDVYMTSAKNFTSRVAFEQVYYNSLVKKEGDEHWNAIDRIIKVNFLSKTRYKKYFKEKLSSAITGDTNSLSRAMKVYTFIRDHYTWNQSNNFTYELDLKKAFYEKKGNLGEINLALLNALQATGIKASIVLLSTRNNSKITDVHPILTDFNYILIRVPVQDQIYYLDATNRHHQFGQIPFQCLNGKVRVFDLKNPSFWEEIPIVVPTLTKITTRVVFSQNDTLFKGISKISNYGYNALHLRNTFAKISEKEYKRNKSSNILNLEIDKLQLKNQHEVTKPVLEVATFSMEPSLLSNTVFEISPHAFSGIQKNPFSLKKRMYPVDFGIQNKWVHLFQLSIPPGYVVTSLPKNTAFSIRDNEMLYYFQIEQKSNTILAKSIFEINKPIFSASNYEALKAFYSKVIESQKEQIIIKKQ